MKKTGKLRDSSKLDPLIFPVFFSLLCKPGRHCRPDCCFVDLCERVRRFAAAGEFWMSTLLYKPLPSAGADVQCTPLRQGVIVGFVTVGATIGRPPSAIRANNAANFQTKHRFFVSFLTQERNVPLTFSTITTSAGENTISAISFPFTQRISSCTRNSKSPPSHSNTYAHNKMLSPSAPYT